MKNPSKITKLILEKVPVEKVLYFIPSPFKSKQNFAVLEHLVEMDYIVNRPIGKADPDVNQDEITAISTPSEGMTSPDVTIALNVFEYLTNNFGILRAIQTRELIISISKQYFKTVNIQAMLEKTNWRVLDIKTVLQRQGIRINTNILLHCEKRNYGLSRYDGKTLVQLKEIERNLRFELDKLAVKIGKAEDQEKLRAENEV
jgi:hypothetical protein